MEPPIVFFDDICVLCSRSVQFIFRHDRKGSFRFASLDSAAFRELGAQLTGKKVAEDLFPDSGQAAGPGSVVLFMNGKVFRRSSAALHIASRLRFPWNLLAAGWILPPFIRDAAYDWIARNRYRWFGKRETCFIPQGAFKARVLE